MSAAWTAGAVRALALARRRAGTDLARRAAACVGLDEALQVLSGTPYARRWRPGIDLAAAEYAVDQTLLWNLRVLAGWQSRAGVDLLRAVACRFEAATIVGRLRKLGGTAVETPDVSFELGALAVAWRGVRRAETVEQLRRALAASPWGDPGTVDPAATALFLRLSGAARWAALGPQAARWAAAEAAVALARARFLAGRRPEVPAARMAARLIGVPAAEADSWEHYVRRLPAAAVWVFRDVSAPDELWRAEAAGRRREEIDAHELLRGGDLGADTVLGAAVLLTADARRVSSAVESAARHGRAREVFDAVA